MAVDHRETHSRGVPREPSFGDQQRSGDVLPGSLASLDSTLPPTPLKDLLAADGASVYVYSLDGDLNQAVQQAGGDQYPVRVVEEWAELVAAVAGGRSKIVLLDVDSLPVSIEKALDELQHAADALVVLVAARRDEAQPLMSLLSERQIHRLLIKPAALGITRLLLESAVTRYLQLRETGGDDPARTAELPRVRSNSALPLKWPAWLIATALVSVLLGALLVTGITRFTSQGAEPPGGLQPTLTQSEDVDPATSPRDETTGDTTQGDGAVSSASEPAVTSVSSDRLGSEIVAAQPSEPNSASPTDVPANQPSPQIERAIADPQIENAIADLFATAEAALLEGSLEAAAAALSDIRRVQPSSGRLSFLDEQLNRARTATAGGAPDSLPAATPTFTAPDAPTVRSASPELDSLLTMASTRLQQDQLLEPAGDSARDYLGRAAAIDAAAPGVVSLRAALAAAVADTARMALDLGDLEEASRFNAEAASLGADPEVLRLLDVDLSAAQAARVLERHAEALATGTSRLQQGQLIAPDEDNALFFLASIRRDTPEFPGLAGPWQSLIGQIEANIARLLSAGDWQGADQWISALAGSGAEPDRVAELRVESLQAQFLATPAPARTLRLLEQVPAVYPPDALRVELQGWVDLDYIVDTDGRTRAITVLDSQPGRRFDQAAIDAVSQQRYQPFEQDGRLYERRLQLRIRFTLE